MVTLLPYIGKALGRARAFSQAVLNDAPQFAAFTDSLSQNPEAEFERTCLSLAAQGLTKGDKLDVFRKSGEMVPCRCDESNDRSIHTRCRILGYRPPLAAR